MVGYFTIPSNENCKFSEWSQMPQLEIEAEDWQELAQIAKFYSAINGNRTVRLCKTKGYNNQGHYINNYHIKIKEA